MRRLLRWPDAITESETAGRFRGATRTVRLSALLWVSIVSCLVVAGCTGTGTPSASRSRTDFTRSEATPAPQPYTPQPAAPSAPGVTSSATVAAPAPASAAVDLRRVDWNALTVPATFC